MSRGDAIRLGLVGAGFMAKLHTFAFETAALRFPASCPPVRLTRVADLDEDLARSAAAELGWEAWTRDWQTVTRADDIDLVLVATSVASHVDVCVDAFAHGKHVLCEKPLARNSAEAGAAYDAAVAAGTLHATGFAMRHWPAVRLAERILAGGALGRLVKVRAHYLLDWAAPADLPISWRFRRASAGSGSLGDVGSHVLDVMRAFAGEIVSVYARLQTVRPTRPTPTVPGHERVDVDDAADLVLEFDGGVGGVMETSWAAPGHKTDIEFELIGDEGALRFSWARNDELQVAARRPHGSPVLEIRPVAPEDQDLREFAPAAGTALGLSELFVLQSRAVLSGLATGRWSGPDFLDGLRVCEAIDAALTSNEQGRCVPVLRTRG
jgi:predicted dehydrogenase